MTSSPTQSAQAHPHLGAAPVAVTSVRTSAQPEFSAARTWWPAFIAELLLAVVALFALLLVAVLGPTLPAVTAKTVSVVVTLLVVACTGSLLRRTAIRGRPAMWTAMICLAWGVVTALWITEVLSRLLPASGWAEGLFTSEDPLTGSVSEVLMQAAVLLGFLIPALGAPTEVRGASRGFLISAAAGLGLGTMQAILALTGGHVVGVGNDDDVAAMLHTMSLPVVQAFVTGWGGAVVGRALLRGRAHLVYAWPVAVLVATIGIAAWQGAVRIHILCHAGTGQMVCAGTQPTEAARRITVALTALALLGLVLTCTALGARTARLRRAAMAGLVEYGWYTPQEAATLASRPARRRLSAWAARRGARAQARSMVATAERLMQIRMEIEDLSNPVPVPRTVRAGVLEDQEALLQRSLSARESLRTAAAHGPGGWTAA